MAIGNKFLSLFVEVDQTKEAPQKQQQIPSSPVNENKKEEQLPVQGPPKIVLPSQVNQEFLEILEKEIEKNNLEGYDYLEFREALGNMASIPMTESQKFQAAFAAAQSMGVSKEALINAIDHYISVINNKKTEFESFILNVKEKEIALREQEIQSIDSEIENAAKQIQQLTEQITEKKTRKDSLSQEMYSKNIEIKNKEEMFNNTHASVVQKLNSDKEKINNNL